VSVEQPDVVDIISTDTRTGHVVLISDHLDWSDSPWHQAILQTKLNRYLAFVESGELLQRYENAAGRPVAIKVVFKFRPDKDGGDFLSKARAIIEAAGFSFRHKVFADD